jgi:hypothetical protein
VQAKLIDDSTPFLQQLITCLLAISPRWTRPSPQLILQDIPDSLDSRSSRT